MTVEHRRARERGKAFERKVAAAFGGKRHINRGQASSDIDGTPWSIEATRCKKLRPSKWNQAIKNARLEGREPVLVYAEPRQRLGDALVVCRFELFHSLFTASVEKETP